MSARKFTDDQLVALHGEGLGRNSIAKKLGVSGDTVTKHCQRLGLTFDREATRAAVAARKADAAALRAELEVQLLEDAHRLRGQLWQPHTYVDHGGRDFNKVEWTQDEPSPGDKYRLMQAAGVAIDRSLRIAQVEAANGDEPVKAMLVQLGRALGIIDQEPADAGD